MNAQMEAEQGRVPSFPFERGGLAPPEQYTGMREAPGLSKVRMWDGSIAWLATRYDDVRALLADNRFSADTARPGFPHVAPARQTSTTDGPQQFIRMDPPDHGRMRRMLTREFTHSRIQSLRPMVERIVDELFDRMLAKQAPVDLIQEFAFPLPSIVIAELIGIPHEYHRLFQECSHKKVAFDVSREEVAEAGEQIRAFLSELFKRKEANPEAYDDIMGRLIIDWIRPGHLGHDEAVAMIEGVLMAGHETTANMLALGTLSLLQHREQFEMLRNDPSPQLVRQAVEEMLRFHTILQFTGARIAREDVEFRGEHILAGQGILAMINSANRDESKFPDPDHFDIQRSSLAPHVAFGFGIHQCLGQPLARIELEIYFTKLAQRIPTLALAIPLEDISYRKEMFVHGINALPVSW